jgi:hypothetical protein
MQQLERELLRWEVERPGGWTFLLLLYWPRIEARIGAGLGADAEARLLATARVAGTRAGKALEQRGRAERRYVQGPSGGRAAEMRIRLTTSEVATIAKLRNAGATPEAIVEHVLGPA